MTRRGLTYWARFLLQPHRLRSSSPLLRGALGRVMGSCHSHHNRLLLNETRVEMEVGIGAVQDHLPVSVMEVDQAVDLPVDDPQSLPPDLGLDCRPQVDHDLLPARNRCVKTAAMAEQSYDLVLHLALDNDSHLWLSPAHEGLSSLQSLQVSLRLA